MDNAVIGSISRVCDEAVALHAYWLDAVGTASEQAARSARIGTNELLGLNADLAQAVERTFEETLGFLPSAAEGLHPVALVARMSELGRSTGFLWTETGFKATARFSRLIPTAATEQPPTPVWLPRALVLVAVAADIYTGYALLRERARWFPDLAGPRDWELQHLRAAARVRDTAVSLGGTLIKAGQFASVRPDLLPAAYTEIFAVLRDRVPPHPWPVIEPVIRRELGRRPAEVFATIETEPVAAASLAQVHRARLGDGREVAVKVQYPEIADVVAADLAALEGIVATLGRLEPAVRLQPIVEYLRATLPLELDFRREARAMTELRAALAHRDDVVIPKVVDELSSGRLLVSEFVHGLKITDRQALVRAGIDPRAVARLLNEVYAEQMLRLGYVHADPHPGNLLVQPGPRLVLLDHGLTFELPRPLMRALAGIVRALADGDFAALATALAEAGLAVDAQLDITSLLQLVGVLLGGEQARSAVELGQRLGHTLGHVPAELMTVGRALGLLDGITRTLDSDMDITEVITRYA